MAPSKSTKRSSASKGFTAEERAAMKDRVRELKSASRRGSKADGESEVLAKIAEMPDEDRVMAERVHEIVKKTAPSLTPRTWYGMPAYADGDKVVCFFRAAAKFKTRYATLGFSHHAHLDEGSFWPTDFALTKLTSANETKIRSLLRKAVS